jgi:hypothetical protein
MTPHRLKSGRSSANFRANLIAWASSIGGCVSERSVRSRSPDTSTTASDKTVTRASPSRRFSSAPLSRPGIRAVVERTGLFRRDSAPLLWCQTGVRRRAICSPSVNANEGSRRREMPLRSRRQQWPRRWRGRVGAALVLASAALCGSVPVAAASSSDAQATHAYLIAQYRLVTALLHEAAAARGAESAAARRIARECPGVVSGMPQEPSLKSFQEPPPRVQG